MARAEILSDSPARSDVNYPVETKDPAKKTRKYIAQYGNAMYADWRVGDAQGMYRYRDQVVSNRRFAMGRQDPDQYKRLVSDDDEEEMSYMNVDWQIVNMASKFVDVILGKMRYENLIYCNAIDKISVKKREDEYWKRFSEIKANNFLKELSEMTGANMMPQRGEEEPKTLEELELYFNNEFKLNNEIALELGIEAVLALNDWLEVAKRIKRDMIVDGIAITKVYFNNNGSIKIRNCDYLNMVMGFSKRPDFKDLPHIGEIRMTTINELRKWAGDQITEEEYYEIAQKYQDKHGNGRISETRFIQPLETTERSYDAFRVPVLEFEFKSIDSQVKKKVKNRFGNVELYEKPHDYVPEGGDAEGKRERIETELEMVYTGCLVLDTDVIFNAGLAHNISRNPTNLFEAMFSFSAYAPEMIDGEMQARIERVIPFFNSVQLSWLKLQNAKAVMAPSGYAYEISGLMNVPNAIKGGNFQPLELIKIQRQTGGLLWSRTGVDNNINYQSPVQPTPSNINEIQGWIDDINFSIFMIRQVSGLDAGSDAMLPEKEQPVGTTKIANANSQNALWPLFDGYRCIKENVGKVVADKIQKVVKIKGKFVGLVRALGESTVKVIQIGSDVTLGEYAIFCESAPDEHERQLVEQQIQISLQQRDTTGQGGLTFEDASLIRRIRNTKVQERMISIRRRLRAKEDAEAQAKIAEAVAAQEQQKTIMVKTMEIRAEAASLQFKLLEIDREKSWDYKIKMVDLAAKLLDRKLVGDLQTIHNEQEAMNNAAMAAQEAENIILQGAAQNSQPQTATI